MATNRLMEKDPCILFSRPPNEAQELPTGDQTKTQNPLIFHLKYHLGGITQSDVQAAYAATVRPLIPNRQLLVAVLHPKKLWRPSLQHPPQQRPR
jgi:hypothetical protein